MKKWLLLLFITSFLSMIHAQCIENESSNEEAEAVILPDVIDVWNPDLDTKTTKFRIGGGVNSIIHSSGFGKTKSNPRDNQFNFTTEQWENPPAAAYFEISFPLKTKRSIHIGLLGTFKNLYAESAHHGHTFSLQPDEQQSDVVANTILWDFQKKMKTATILMHLDYELYKFNRFSSIYSRIEAGFTHTSQNAYFEYKDSCNCSHTIKQELNSNLSFTGGLSAGYSFRFSFFELNTSIGYRVFNPINTFSSAEFSAWEGTFEPTSSSAIGIPNPTDFSISKPEKTTFIGQRNGALHLQFGLYFNIGK